MSDRWDGKSQLAALGRPFKPDLVHSNPSGGGQYVAHDVVVQKLLMVVGPYDFELVELIRGYVPGKAADPAASSKRGKAGYPPLENAIVGAVCRLSCVVDGIPVRIEEVGDCEDPNNWPHDGARLKDAMSDAIKRCAMRLGVGLHLWAQADFILVPSLLDRAVQMHGKRAEVALELPEPSSTQPPVEQGSESQAAGVHAAPAASSPKEKGAA